MFWIFTIKHLVTKEISFSDNNIDFKFKESVNTLSIIDFKNYFKKTDLEIIQLFGDYDLNKCMELSVYNEIYKIRNKFRVPLCCEVNTIPLNKQS